MSFKKRNGQDMPSHITEMAESVKGTTNGVTRREFLSMASVFGASTVTAYGMIGLTAPTPAMAMDTPQMGGTVRFQTEVRAM